jgi:hypothetical protein
MQFIRRHWYNLGLPLAVVAVVWALLGHLRTVQLILLLNFVVLTLHQLTIRLDWLHRRTKDNAHAFALDRTIFS